MLELVARIGVTGNFVIDPAWTEIDFLPPRNAMFLMKALWRTQRMMDPRHDVAE